MVERRQREVLGRAAGYRLRRDQARTIEERLRPLLRWRALREAVRSAGGGPDAPPEVIRLAREALAAAPPSAPGVAEVHNILGAALVDQFERTGDGGLVEEAVASFHAAAALLADDQPYNLAGVLCNVIRARHAGFEAGGAGHLDEVGAVAARVLGLPYGHAALAQLLDAVCRVGWARSREGLDPELLPDLARLCQLAADASPEEAVRGKHLGRRALALTALGRHRRHAATLEEALRVARDSEALVGDDDSGRDVLAGAAYALAEHTGDRAMFAEAAQLWRQVLTGVPDGDPRRPGLLNSLGVALRALVEHGGDPALLPECVQVHAESVAATAPGDINLGGRTAMHGIALWRWHSYTSDTATAREAISILRRSVELTSPDHPERWQYLSDLGIALRQLAARLDDPQLLDAAIDAHRQALACRPVHPTTLNNLAAAYHDRYEQRGDGADLHRAIDCWQQALEVLDTGSATYPFAAGGLGTALTERFDRGHDTTDLRRAVELLRAAVDATAGDDPFLIGRLAGLSDALTTWSTNGGGRRATAQAWAALEAAGRVTTGPVSQRIRYATTWGIGLAQAGRIAEAAGALERAVALLPELLPAHLNRPDAEYQLSFLPGLAPAATACALELGQPDRAVELAERSRGVLLALTLRLREDQTRLEREAPDLAARLHALSAAATTAPDPDAPPRWQVLRDREELLARIRALPGFETFLQPEPVPDPRTVAACGPVILINASPLRCDAIAATEHGPSVISLPELSVAAAEEHSLRLDDALRAAHNPAGTDRDRDAAQDRISAVLEWLWDAVCGPVLDALGLGIPPAGEPLPRLWWVPTGPLNLLPLHAAGHHRRRDGNAVLDRVISSYTPTLRALAAARTRAAPPAAPPRTVAVAMGHTRGHPPLRFAGQEAAAVAGRLPGSITLVDTQATRDRVLAELRRHPWAHLSCHAAVDTADPSASHLLLYDGPLRVADLTAQWLPQAELAYLSACQTQRGGPELAEEAIHLSGAFFLAGYTHVIGTYWPILDATAAHLAQHIYQHITAHPGPLGSRPATAVHTTTRALRDRHPDIPSAWAPFAHTGP